jgi:hypothetical protein
MRLKYLVLVGLCFWLWDCSSGSAPVINRVRSGQVAPQAPAAGSGGPAAGTPAKDDPAQPATIAPRAPTTPVATAGSGSMTMQPGASAASTPVSIDQCSGSNAAGLSAADVQKLQSGNGAGPKWLYPYEGTVFPRGLGAPMLMWDGAADAVYIHIQSMAFEYKGCLKPTAAGQLQLPEDIWATAGQKTHGKGDTYSIELTTLQKGAVNGPASLHISIAQATIKGSIYYNSYNSNLAASAPAMGFGGGPMGGVVLRIPQGGKAELFLSGQCIGCHSVSANGSRMTAQPIGGGMAYPLMLGGSANPTGVAAAPRGAFGALYPDGTKYLSMSGAVEVARTLMTSGGGGGSTDATLFDAVSGMALPSHGIPPGALMPMFSPDGSLLVFNDYAADMAHGLALMKYDVATDTASDYKVLVKESGGTLRPGWPFVLPDNDGVVFVRTDGADFSGNGLGIMGGGGLNPGGFFGTPAAANGGGPSSDLYIADVASGSVTVLAKAMGYNQPADASSGMTYLPFGADELHHNFFPTVSPVAAGGYFWVFFDSLRHYGNLGSMRQLWGTAIEIHADGKYTSDPSAPAFYLPGQELGTGNHRAFAALDPCKKDGDKCTSGIDCCGGTCYFATVPEELVEPVGSCSPPMKNRCAMRDERCKTDADCCAPVGKDPPNSCIAGFCAYVSLN